MAKVWLSSVSYAAVGAVSVASGGTVSYTKESVLLAAAALPAPSVTPPAGLESSTSPCDDGVTTRVNSLSPSEPEAKPAARSALCAERSSGEKPKTSSVHSAVMVGM